MTNYRRRRKAPIDKSPQFNVNDQINADVMRVLNDAGEMLGVFTRQEVINMSNEMNLDLIEINPKANPPVVKLTDYNKFKYQFAKSQAAKQVKIPEMKQIRVSVRISEHDLKVQANKVDIFIEKGIKVRLQVQMRGREKQHPQVAEETMLTFLNLIAPLYIFENEPKLSGDSVYATLKPKSS